MARLVQGIKSGFLNFVGALKCGGRPATVEVPISSAAGEAHGKVEFVVGAGEDLYVEEAEYESVQVMRIVEDRDVGGQPAGSQPGTG